MVRGPMRGLFTLGGANLGRPLRAEPLSRTQILMYIENALNSLVMKPLKANVLGNKFVFYRILDSFYWQN